MKRDPLPAPKPQTPSERARRLFEVLRAALPAMTAEEFAESEKKLAERCGVTL